MLIQSKLLIGVTGWQTFSIILLCVLGTGKSNFLSWSWGPQDDLKFLNFCIDTWSKYIGFVVWLVVDTTVNTGAEMVIYPWITNEVMDLRHKDLPCSFREMVVTSTGYEFYSCVRGVIMIYFSFTQIDFLVMKILLDTLCQFIVSWKILKAKTLHDKNTVDEETPLLPESSGGRTRH